MVKVTLKRVKNMKILGILEHFETDLRDQILMKMIKK